MKTIRLAGVLLAALLPAWSAAADDAPAAEPRLSLKAPPAIEPAVQQGGRFTLRARFAPASSSGDLREGANFTLIGRFAKLGASCDFNALFADGFEGP